MTIVQLITNIKGVLNQIIGLLFVVATVVFLWGVIKYVVAGGDEKKLDEGRNFIIYGIVGLFVMLAMWGIVRAVCYSIFGVSSCGS